MGKLDFSQREQHEICLRGERTASFLIRETSVGELENSSIKAVIGLGGNKISELTVGNGIEIQETGVYRVSLSAADVKYNENTEMEVFGLTGLPDFDFGVFKITYIRGIK